MYNLLKSILPARIKEKLNSYVLQELGKKWEDQANKMPHTHLLPEQIAHTRVVLDRVKLLELLPQGGIVAEVGVDKGDFSKMILEITQPEKLHLVDLWGSAQYPGSLMNVVQEKFQQEISLGKVEINRGLSIEVGRQFPDHYFDWVYIDTDHSYLTTKGELEVYSQKVKPDGIIAGHDFIQGNWNKGVRYGVIEAVYDFCRREQWEIIYLTMENHIPPSFAIQRIK